MELVHTSTSPLTMILVPRGTAGIPCPRRLDSGARACAGLFPGSFPTDSTACVPPWCEKCPGLYGGDGRGRVHAQGSSPCGLELGQAGKSGLEVNVARNSTRHTGGLLCADAGWSSAACAQTLPPARVPLLLLSHHIVMSGVCLTHATSATGLASVREGKSHNAGEFLE